MLIALWLLSFDRDMMISFGLFWILVTIPVLYLHIEYYIKNRNEYIEITDDQISVKVVGKDTRNYRFADLDKIILYKSASQDKGGMPILPLEFYHFARIIPKHGKDIVITCLMTPDVEGAIREIKWVAYDRRKIFFATLERKL